MSPAAAEVITQVLYEEQGRLLALLIRGTGGDFQLAEDALQQAALAALEQWGERGVPARPAGWLLAAARRKAIDRIRRDRSFDRKRVALEAALAPEGPMSPELDDAALPDERLRLIFTCCHPALEEGARVALTLRTLCGLTTEEIARAFFLDPRTLAQRLVRAQRKIRDAGIPYVVPPIGELLERLDAVLQVVYLVFNEGYAASFGDSLTRGDLATEAIRLGRLLVGLLPEDGEVHGLLALMLLQDARRAARTDPHGGLVLLEAQDRRRWDRAMIEEGLGALDRALRRVPPGPATLQAAIAAVHAQAPTAAATDWPQIVGLYRLLLRASPSPVIALNLAVAVAMSEGPAAGLAMIEPLRGDPHLERGHLLPAAEADLLRRLGDDAAAAGACRRALERVGNGPERRFLEARLVEVEGS